MKMFTKVTVSGLLWLTFSALTFGATLNITGQTENVEQGGQFSAFLSSDPNQTLYIYCVDFRNFDTPLSQVNISIPNTLVPSSVANTRYGNTATSDFTYANSGPNAINAVERYVLAGYLVTQYNFSSGVTLADDQIQNAIWSLLDVNGTSGFPAGDNAGTGNFLMQAQNWFNSQSASNLAAFESDIRIFTSTDTTSYTTGSQEMITVTPEPATLAMLGAGLVAVGLLRKRAKA